MIEFSSSLKLNEIDIVDSPFNEDPKKCIFFHGGPNFVEGRPEKLGKMGNSRDIYCYANRGVQFRKRISGPTPWYQNLVTPQFSYMSDQILRKNGKSQISGQSLTFL